MSDVVGGYEAAAEYLGGDEPLSLRTLRRLVASGELPVVKINSKTVRFLRDDLDRLIESRRLEAIGD